jgi:D-alanyl-D-alanine carboxypeptidase/D-alanyl-D-alanine-endopeptidase (penicillin-binding protein 4)
MYEAMKKLFFCWVVILSSSYSFAQNISTKLATAFQNFESDPQLKTAIASLYVVDGKTGKPVFEKNAMIGLAPASTQKIITSATAYELLGKDFRYQTMIGYDNSIRNGELQGNLYVEGNGDPTLGSFRWSSTKDSVILQKIVSAIKIKGIRKIRGDLWIDNIRFGINPVPDGWIWEDIGNYYGAGGWGLNWRENQYDLVLKPSATGAYTEVVKTNPLMYDFKIANFIKTGEKGSGDNGYIYFSPYSKKGFATGTVPAGTPTFTISGSMPDPARQFGFTLLNYLNRNGIASSQKLKLYSDSMMERKPVRKAMQLLDSIASPSLDSMTYWFLKKSINLYGECFIKTFAYQKYYSGNTEQGVSIVKAFWKEKGIDPVELNMVDGSGLSPLNRVTTRAQVSVLQYAKKQSWFLGYYNAFPEYNGMKMKSGTINGAKSFCGYQQSKDGAEYTFSFIVNNYNGSASALVQKMYRVLDELK